MKLSIDNWNLPSNKKFKLIADVLLYLSPVLTPIIAGLQPVSPVFALWTVALLNISVVVVKAISKFSAEEAVAETPVETPAEAVKDETTVS